jgi:uncharacterized membrane protein (GlpM family)
MKYLLYFFLGGLIVSLIAYLGGMKKTLLSAFIATLPTLSVVTFVFVYREGGQEAALSYAKGLLLFTPAWLSYIGLFVFLLPRTDIWKALVLSVFLYFFVAFLTKVVYEGFYKG